MLATPSEHTVNGRKTAVKDIVHYTDHNGQRHPARIEKITGDVAHLHVFHAHGETRDHDVEAVSHSATPGQTHTWNHLPE